MKRSLAFVFGLALVLVLATGHARAATVNSTQVSPAAPVWSQKTTFSVYLSGCNLDFQDRTTSTEGDTTVIVLHFDEQDCASPTPLLYRLSRSFAPGNYLVRVETTQGTAGSFPFTVYDTGASTIDVLVGPPTNNNPVHLQVHTYRAPCMIADAPQVDGRVIRLGYHDECASTQAAEVVEDQVFLPPMPAGLYDVQIYMPRGDGMTVSSHPLRVYDWRRCVPWQGALCLQKNRFRVKVNWHTAQASGVGLPIEIDGFDDTGLFYFFNPRNVELTVKVLNGCVVNNHFWVFVSSGSTVGYDIEVTDTLFDETRTYSNELGHTPALIPDTGAFATCL